MHEGSEEPSDEVRVRLKIARAALKRDDAVLAASPKPGSGLPTLLRKPYRRSNENHIKDQFTFPDLQPPRQPEKRGDSL